MFDRLYLCGEGSEKRICITTAGVTTVQYK
jgi:hypothetical protein